MIIRLPILLFMLVASTPEALLAVETAAATLSNQNSSGFHLDATNSTISIPLQISNGTHVSLWVSSDVRVDVAIIDPNGLTVPDSQLQVSDATMMQAAPLAADVMAPLHHVRFHRNYHAPGIWTIQISLPAGVPAATGIAKSSVSGGIAASIWTSRSVYPVMRYPMPPISLGVAVLDNGQPVQNATVTVEIYRPGESSNVLRTAQLSDNGVTPDAVAGDGLYSGDVDNFHYEIKAVAEARVVSGQSDFRVMTSFESIKSAHLHSVVEKAVRVPGMNRFIERIDFTARIDYLPGKPADWELEVCISAINESILCRRKSTSSFDYQDSHFFTLSVYADEIIDELRVDGPYEVRSRLFALVDDYYQPMVSQLDELSEAYVLDGDGSDPTIDSLFHGRQQILPGILDERLIDADNDGIFEMLEIDVEIKCLMISCSGRLAAQLVSEHDEVIQVGSTYDVTMPRGINVVSILFFSDAIGRSATNGPYNIRQAMYRDGLPNPGNRGTFRKSIGTTGFYPYTIFEEAPPGIDADFDGIPDTIDNCMEFFNPEQIDSNDDGFGNRCDADLNNDGIVNFADLSLFQSVFFTADPDADFDGNGAVDFRDLSILHNAFFLAPGPGAL